MRILLFLLLTTATLSGQAPPNIVLIVSDDHGADDLGCYGNPAIRTPNLDALAAEAVRFTRAFCTSASCSASRSVILTGKHNHSNGQFGHSHDFHHFRTFDTIVSLPTLLARKGYFTGRIGKFHLAPESVYPFNRVLPGDARNPAAMADTCRHFLREVGERPFFLYFCTSDPHRGGGFADDLPHAPDRFGNLPGGHPGTPEMAFFPQEVRVPPYLPDSPAARAELAQYYQSVYRMDYGIGRLFEALKENGHWDNTLVVYLSDNGIAFPGAKTNLYEPGMRLPFLAKLPFSRRAGVSCDAMVSWVDIAPTLLDFAGRGDEIAKPGFHGRSFRGALETGLITGWDTVFASHTFHEITMYYPMRVVRAERFKLIWNIAHGLSYPHATDLWESPTWQWALQHGQGRYGPRAIDTYLHRPAFELYDLENDPLELYNLAEDPALQTVLETLIASLKAFQARTADPWLAKWIHE